MPTQQQIDDLLALGATYRTKKAISDEASKVSESALKRSQAARAAWDACLDDGENDEGKLTALITAVQDTEMDSIAKSAAADTANSETSTARNAIGNYFYTLTHPE